MIQFVKSETEQAFNEVYQELKRAMQKWPYPEVGKAHYGFAVIHEELDELWDAVKRDDIDHAKKEAHQVAATAIRFILEA